MPTGLKMALAGAAALAAVAMAAPTADAASITFNFTASGGTASGSGYANTRTYTQGGVTLTVRGFALVGSATAFSAANVGYYSGAGLGLCNSGEGLSCSSPSHQVDNDGSRDFALFQFSQAITVTSALVQTYSRDDTDVSYFLGNAANPLSLLGVTVAQLAGLGFGGEVVDNGSEGSNAQNTIAINGGPFNSLLLGAQIGESDDAFKIRTLTIEYTAVPEPMTLSLLATGVLGLGVAARRRRRSRRA